MKKYIAVIVFLFGFTSIAYSQSEPPYGMKEIEAYSIFYDNYRAGDYHMALQFGKWMLEKKPTEIQGLPRFELSSQFDRMITVYSELSKGESDPTMSAAYLDTATALFDEAFETFDEETIDYFEWHIDKGRFYQEYQENIDNATEQAVAEYEKAYELDAERFAQASDGYYARVLLGEYVSNEERDKALTMIDAVEPHAGSSLAASISEARNELFSDPEERIGFLESQLEENPGDEDLLNELSTLYLEQGNREKAIEYAEQVYETNPSYDNIMVLAEYAEDNAENQQALNYLQEALEVTDDVEAQKRITIKISETYQNMGNLESARRFARQAANLDSSWGQPYIRIAGIYAGAISECTSGRQMDRNDRTVYWLVLDYLDRARSADPSVASTVSRQYQSYQPVLPSSEDKFFSGWETGDSFQVGSNISDCYAWINETTTVR